MPDVTPPSQRLKLAVVGLGGIGGALAVALRAADRHDVVACARRPLAGLVLEWNDATLDLPLNVATDPRAVGPADWVMLSTKAHQTPDAAPWLASLCRPGTRVAVLQNGIDHVARVAPFAAGAAVVPVVIYYNSEQIGADRVRCARSPGMILWWRMMRTGGILPGCWTAAACGCCAPATSRPARGASCC